MKTPSAKSLTGDFFLKALPTSKDLCLDFKRSEATPLLEQRLNVIVVEDFKTLEIQTKYGFCVDFLEHFPQREVPKVLNKVLLSARRCYFHIGAKGKTSKALWWWMHQFHKQKAKILAAEQGNFGYKIYATAYTSTQDLDDWSSVNINDAQITKNIVANLSLGLREVEPFGQQDLEVALVLGGPTLNDFKEQIYQQAKEGIPVITANGAYNWCLENKIKPAAQIILDGRAFNKRFVEPFIETCKYLLCSQCDPELVLSIPRDNVWLWHPYGDIYNRTVKDFHKDKEFTWYPVPGGTTVGLRAIPLLIMLGYHKMHVYGFDSCIVETRHHGFPQPEDDRKKIMTVEYGGRKFRCYPWMVHQCDDFFKMTQHMIGPLCDLEVYGDGLIAHCIRTLGESYGSDQVAVLQQREAGTGERLLRHRRSRSEDASVQELG